MATIAAAAPIISQKKFCDTCTPWKELLELNLKKKDIY